MSRPVRWPRYEPLIVTTLRHYRRRGAPESLLVRLAGGARDWRHLNATWNLDGSRPVAASVSIAIEPIDGSAYPLSAAERRIGLLQLADDCTAAGVVLPTLKVLGGLFGVSRYVIAHDLEVLRRDGRLDWHLVSDGATGVRRIPEAA